MRRALANVGLVGLVTVGVAGVAADAATLASHRAFYTMAMIASDTESNVVGANGAMTVDWERSCDGWTVSQQLRLQINLNSGELLDTAVEFSSFESLDGTSYQFTSRTLTNGTVLDEFRGIAKRAGPDQPGEVRYAMPEARRLALPADTVFPMEHTRLVLEAAERGETVVLRKFFDGPRPDESPFDANALILQGPRPGSEGVPEGLADASLLEDVWWPLRIAFFPAGSNDGSPDFELEAKAHGNGVVREFVFDYGDFSVRAMLAQLEPVVETACGG